MATSFQPAPPPAQHVPFSVHLKNFWRRVTEGLALSQLWSQFESEARASYRLYSKDVAAKTPEGLTPRGHHLHVVKEFFWAVFEKLSPARRVLLLLALILLVIPNTAYQFNGQGNKVYAGEFETHFWAGLLLLLLLLLEIGDRVVMKRDLQIAKEIQSWLLPGAPPQIPGITIAYATKPANTVAGDYYDVFPRPSSDPGDNTFLIAVADVAGKSIPAALLMATFQASLKALAPMAGPLVELAGRLNAYAYSNSQNGRRFITTFLGEYDPASRKLSYINAGHNPPILRRTSGAIEHLQTGGIPLGVQENAAYESATATLQTGDWLIIYTDGVIEAENERADEYGEARLLTMLHANTAVPPAMLLNTIMVDLDRFVGNAPQHDDVTLMLLKAT